MERKELPEIVAVFRLLELETEDKREGFRRLAKLKDLGNPPERLYRYPLDTRNNTVEEKQNAKLEPTA
jgi:hypothetical protein